MAWSGGTFSGLYDWVVDAAAGTRILASRHKAQDDVFIAGINQAVNKDGSNALTGNLNAGSQKLTSVSAATLATDAPIASQVQDGSMTYAVDSGGANAYVIALAPAESAHVGGQVIWFKASAANTGASTLNVNGIGVKDIKKNHGQALIADDIVANQLIGVVYDATTGDFEMVTMPAMIVANLTGNVTGNASGSALTVTQAAQTAITSVGTLTALQVDNININGNAITSTAGTDLTISPVSGQQIVLDGAIVVDAGVVTGATSITSTAFVGDITGDVTGTSDVATVATTVTITDNESTDESNAIIFTAGGDIDGGNLGLESDGDLTYNPSTGKVTATGFVGALTGNVTGNVTGNASGTALTVTQAAQSAITSVGTITNFVVSSPDTSTPAVSVTNDGNSSCFTFVQTTSGEACGTFRGGNDGATTLLSFQNSSAAQTGKITNSGNLTLTGSITKGSGSFRIPHPVESKKDSHYLVHSFIEGPQADLIYRGKVTLSSGSATVNIDTVSGITAGTFILLCRDVQCFTTNETGWTAIKGSVSGNILTITAESDSCTDTISWMVVGERKDPHMISTSWTDDDGHVVVEPEVEVDEE